MIEIFYIKLILSFVVGSIWITLLSVFAEKLGARIGGAIAGIPATMVVALFFIGWTQTPQVASQATTIVPLIVGINAMFTILYISLYRFGFYISLIASLIFWFILSYFLVLTRFDNFVYSLLGYFILLLLSYYILEKKLNIKTVGGKKINYTLLKILFRSAIGGFVIAFSVLMAKISGPLLGGIFASFPALTVALIIIMNYIHGFNFTASLLKNFIISGTVNVVFFTIAVRYTYVYLGLMLGTITSLLLSFLSAYLTYQFINKKLS